MKLGSSSLLAWFSESISISFESFKSTRESSKRKVRVTAILDNAARATVEPLEKRTMMAATPLYWDPSGAATASGGSGTWNTTTAEWRSGTPTGALVAWSNAGDANGPYQAVFPASGGTVTIGASVSAFSMSFTAANYTLTGGSSLSLVNGTGQIDVSSGLTTVISAPIGGSTGLTKTSAGQLNLLGTNTYTGGTRLNAGTLSVNSDAALGAVPASASTNISFTGTATLQASASSVSLSSKRGISIGNSLTATLDSQLSTFAVNGSISNTASSGSLAKGGLGGTLILAGSNSFASGTILSMGGGTNVGAGILQLTNSAALGVNPITVDAHFVQNNAVATLSLAGGITISSNVTYLVGGHQPAYNVDLNSVSGNNTFNGTFTIDNTGGNYAIQSSDAAGTFTLGGSITNAITSTNRGLIFQGAGNGVINGIISDGSGSIAPSFSGNAGTTWTINNTQQVTGATTINSGTVALNTYQPQYGTLYGTSAGGAVTINSSGTLLAQNVNSLTGYSNSNTAVTVNAGGTLADGPGTNHITNLTLAGGTMSGNAPGSNFGGFDVQANTTVNVTASSTISEVGLVTEPGATFNIAAGQTLTLSGSLMDPASHSAVQMVTTGSGTLLVTGNSTNSGFTQINGGQLRLGNGGTTGSLGSGGISLGGGSSLVFNQAGSWTFSNSVSLGAGTEYISSAGGAVTLSSSISGAGSLNLTGGTISLPAANTYSGGTIVTSGTLLVTNATGSATSLGNVTVYSGATLAGTGSIAGSVTLNSGAFLSPGGPSVPTAILKTGSLTLVSGAYLLANLNSSTAGSGYDQVQAAGTIILNGAILSLTTGSIVSAGGTRLALLNSAAGAIQGTFSNVAENAAFNLNGTSYSATYLSANAFSLINTTPGVSLSGQTLVGKSAEVTLNSNHDLGNVDSSGNPVQDNSPDYSTGSAVYRIRVDNGPFDPDLTDLTLHLGGSGTGTYSITVPSKLFAWNVASTPVRINSGQSISVNVPAAGLDIPLKIEGKDLSYNDTNQNVVVSYVPHGQTTAMTDSVNFKVIAVAMYIDADNNNGFGAPDGSNIEGAAKQDPNGTGKIITADQSDSDGDGIPDFADGYNLDGSTPNSDDLAGATSRFVPLLIQMFQPVDFAHATIRFDYSGSNPIAASLESPAPGYLRLWLKDGSVQRNGQGVGTTGGGDYIVPGVTYLASKLGFNGVLTNGYQNIVIYAEGIRPVGVSDDPDRKITMTVDPDGNGAFPVLKPARVNVTVVPPRPTGSIGLSASVADTHVGLTWTYSANDQTSFVITRALDLQFQTEVSTIPVADWQARTFTDSPTPGSTYYYKIAPTNYGTSGNFSNVVTAVVPFGDAPVLKATADSLNRRIALSWNDVAGENGFNIYRGTSASSVSLYKSISTGVTESFDASATPGVTYFYTVAPVDRFGQPGTQSAAVSASLAVIGSGPIATFDVTGDSSEGGSLAAAFTAPSGSGPFYYSFDFDNDGVFEIQRTTSGSTQVPASFHRDGPATLSVRGRIFDSTGLFTDYVQTVGITNVAPSINLYGGVISGGERAKIHAVAIVQDPSLADTLAGFQVSWSVKKNGVDYTSGTGSDIYFETDGVATYSIYATARDKDNATTVPPAELDISVTPNAPSSLIAQTISQQSIHLVWADNSSFETKFEIQARPQGTSTFSKIGQVDTDITSFIASGLAPGTLYEFRVIAEDATTLNAPSASAFAYTIPTAPSAPTIVNVTSSSVSLSLNLPDSNPAVSYYSIEYRVEGAIAWNSTSVSRATGSLPISNLRAGVTYDFRARVTAGSNVSPYSVLASAKTSNLSPPNPPSSLTGTASAIQPGSTALTWTDNSDNEAYFNLQFSLDGVAWKTIPNSPAHAGTGQASSEVNGLAPGRAYQFRVRATNESGNSDWAYGSGQTSSFNAPYSLSKVGSDNNFVTLSWNYNNNSQWGFVIEQKGPYDPEFRLVGTAASNARQTTVGSLLPNSNYIYRVRAYAGSVSGATQSNNSSPLTILTTSILPQSPTVSASLTSLPEQATVIWTDTQQISKVYRVEFAAEDNVWHFYTNVPSTSQTTYSRLVDGLQLNTTYSFRVTSVNDVGDSTAAFSNSIKTRSFNSPTNLRLSSSQPLDSNTSVRLQWDSQTPDATGYIVEGSLNGSIGYRELARVTGSSSTIALLTKLVTGGSYTFRVRAFYSGGQGGYLHLESVPSIGLAKAMTSVKPADPTDLSAMADASKAGVVNLSWIDHAYNEKSFEIQATIVATPQDSDFLTVAFAEIDSQSASITNLNSQFNYTFRVRAINDADSSLWSNTSSATPTGPKAIEPQNPGTVPTAPVIAAATGISPGRIDVTWSDVPTNQRNGYTIEVSTSATGNDFSQVAAVSDATATSYSLLGLTPLSHYRVRVRGFNGAGVSPASEEVSATTLAFASPSDLNAVAKSAHAIHLDWTDNSGAIDELGFIVEMSADGQTFSEIGRSNGNTRAFLATDLAANRLYYFRVRAYAQDSGVRYTSAPSQTIQAEPLHLDLPNAPSGVTASPISATQIEVSWQDVSDNEDGFRVLIWRNSVDVPDLGEFVTPTSSKINSDVTSVIVSNLDPNTPYEFRVRSYVLLDPAHSTATDILTQENLLGFSSVSNLTEAVTLPAIPAGLRANIVDQNVVNVSWNAVDGAVSYNVQRSDDGQTWSAITRENSSLTQLSISDAAHVIYFRVNATTLTGTSEWSLPIASALASAPGSFAATATSTSTIHLTWTAVANASGYIIQRYDGSSSNPVVTTIPDPTVLERTDDNLLDGTLYSYQIQAVNSLGNSSFAFANAWTRLQPPEMVTTTIASGSHADLTWRVGFTTAYGVNYVIQIASAALATPQLITVGPTTWAAIESQFVGNASYTFRVKSVADYTSSEFSQAVIVTAPNFPPAPTNLAFSNITSTSVSLAWTGSLASGSAFSIERALSGRNSWMKIGETAGNFSTDSNLEEGTKYDYRVSAVSSIGSSYYASGTVDTQLGTPLIAAVTSLSGTQIALDVSDGSNVSRYYDVFDALTNVRVLHEYWSGVDGTLTIDGQFSPLSTHSYYVVASPAGNSGAASGQSNTVTLVTANYPLAPQNLTVATSDNGSAQLAWEDHSINESTFLIERKTGANWYTIGTAPAGTIAFSDYGLSDLAPYTYRVSAINAVGASYYAVSDSVQIPPNAPIGISAQKLTGNFIRLNWADSSQSETGFTVEYRKASDTIWSTLGTTSANTTTFEAHVAFDPQTQYLFHVRAQRGTVSSRWSETSVTSGLWPHAPSALGAVAVSEGQIDLTWQPSPDASSYAVYRRRSGRDWVRIDVGSSTTYSDFDVEPSYYWTYAVVAVNSDGESGFSNIQNLTTPYGDPLAPTSLQTSVGSDGSITLTWDKSQGLTNSAGFVIERTNPNGPSQQRGTKMFVITTVGPDVTTWTDTNTTAATTYFYQVSAIRPDGIRTLTLPDHSQVQVGNATNISYGIAPFEIPGSVVPAIPGGSDPGAPPKAPPAGYPLGRPDDGTNSPKVYKVKINGQSERDFGNAADDAPNGSARGKAVFKDEWIQATSPQDAIIKAVVSNTIQVKIDGQWVNVQFGNKYFFDDDAIDWHPSDSSYWPHIANGTNDLVGEWMRTCLSLSVLVPWVELNVDSNNDDGFDMPTSQNHGQAEDLSESDPAKPGKIIQIDDTDLNGNGIPDFADFDTSDAIDANGNSTIHFVPMTIAIPNTIDLSKARLKIHYASFSDPNTIRKTGSGTSADPYVYEITSGDMRIWSKDASKPRKSEYITAGGDLIKSDDIISGVQLIQMFGGKYEVTLWLEAVKQSGSSQTDSVTAELDPGPDSAGNFVATDTLCTTNVALRLAVDANGDGTIHDDNISDSTTTKKPFHFWLNDNSDVYYTSTVEGGGGATSLSGLPLDSSSPYIGSNVVVNGTPLTGGTSTTIDPAILDQVFNRDLEDFAQVGLWYPASTSYAADHVELILESSTDPQMSIRLSRSANPGGWSGALFSATDPISNPSVAAAVENVTQNYLHDNPKSFLRLNANTTLDMTLKQFEQNFGVENKGGTFNFMAQLMFEGIIKGAGRLLVKFIKDSHVFAQSGFNLDLHPITDYFEHYTVSTGPGVGANGTWSNSNITIDPKTVPVPTKPVLIAGSTAASFATSKDYFLLVHGWNTTEDSRILTGSTAFKRLYWQGYRGTVGLFDWPTQATSNPVTDPGNFNRSEEVAWNSGMGLLDLLRVKQSVRQAGGKLVLMGHSMGAIVTSEALALAGNVKLVDATILTQAAVTSELFAGFAQPTPTYATFNGQVGGTSPRFRHDDDATIKFINFYNGSDYALRAWYANNLSKPGGPIHGDVQALTQTGYGGVTYEIGTSPVNNLPDIERHSPVAAPVFLRMGFDTYEMLAHGLYTDAFAMGATAGTVGPFTDSFDLASIGFVGTRTDHSGQFNHSYIEMGTYWKKVVTLSGLL